MPQSLANIYTHLVFSTKHRRLDRGRLLSLAAALWLAHALAAAEDQANWPRWRGPHDNGSTAQGSYPVKWDTTNLLWQAPLPGKGCSTPVVWAKQIFLTATVEGLDAALAYDWAGKPLWQTTLGPGQAGKRLNSSGSNPSPATDGQGLFVYFKSGALAALGFDGKVRWQTNLVAGFGRETLFWDQGTSPVLTDNTVVIARMHHGESWLAAFDKASGKLRWKVARNYETPVEGDNSYTTPIVIGLQDKEAVLVWGAEHVTAHAAADGRLLWSCGGFNPRAMGHWPTVASPVVAGEVVVVASGRADRAQPRLEGIKLGGAGDVTATHCLWQREDTGTFVPTPAEYEGRLYLLRDRGEVECLDPATGKTLWRQALPKASASYYASPAIAAGKLYAAREDGVVFVAQVAGRFELLAENRLGEQIIASPVPVGNRLLLRGERHLFCVAGE
ncbi:MAG: PQQ-binding-like beta-propeller repeat protein [Verrucomicrobiota bacterium]